MSRMVSPIFPQTRRERWAMAGCYAIVAAIFLGLCYLATTPTNPFLTGLECSARRG